MESRNYRIVRDNVYVGRVIKLKRGVEPYREWKSKSEVHPSGLIANEFKIFRSMLFVPTEDGFAQDLLYKSPEYPVLNIASRAACLNPPKNIIVSDCCRLAKLLRFLGYDEEMTFEDLVELRNSIFTGHWASGNCRLFGLKEIWEEESYANTPNGKNRKVRTFMPTNEPHILPKDYFWALNALDSFGDTTLKEILLDRFFGINSKIDAFNPSIIEEGYIKRLSFKPIKKHHI